MTELTLYHFPNACSQVCAYALEMTSLPYRLNLIDLARGEQSSAEYLAISPLGKVPTLIADGQAIVENAAIITLIAALQPDAGLFPEAKSPFDLASRQAGLSFCGGTLHPIVRGILNPARFTDGDVAPVRSMAEKLAHKSFRYADRRLTEKGSWLGVPSIIDAYLNWAVQTAMRGGYNVSPFAALTRLNEDLLQRPEYARIIENEDRYTTELKQRCPS